MRLSPRFGAKEHCPLCKEAVGEQLAVHVCPSCSTTLHVLCQEELGGCATLGCDARGSMSGEVTVSPERLRHLRGLVTDEQAQTRPWWGHTGPRGFLTAAAVTGLGVALLLLAGSLGPWVTLAELSSHPIAVIGMTVLVLGSAMFIELFTGRRAAED